MIARHTLTGRLGRAFSGVIALVIPLAPSALILPASAAQAVLQPGEAAPLFSKKDGSGQEYRLDKKTTDTVLLVFIKPRDRYTSETLRALERMFDKYPPLGRGLSAWVISSRMDGPKEAAQAKEKAGSRWPVLLDEDNELYHGYKIIATPTVVIVGGDRRVAAVHPGYDLGLVDDVRHTLAKARAIKLPESVTAPPPKPNMALQMGRRLAARGLWEDALAYYQKAMAQGPLPPTAQIELAQIQLELNKPDEALALLNKLPAELARQKKPAELVRRAQELKAGRAQAGRAGKPEPPKVQR